MVVKTQLHGREVIGLMVGAANARRYFSRQVKVVKLHLGDLEIECALPSDFWHGKPEIHDPRLCQWLEYRNDRERPDRKPITLAMVQSGTNSFKLQSTAQRW